MDQCNQSMSSVRLPDHLTQRKFNVGHFAQSFLVNSFTSVMVVGTIDCHHFIPFPVTLTLPGKASGKAKLCGFIFLRTFQHSGMKSGEVKDQFKFNSPILRLSEIYVIEENTYCFTDGRKKQKQQKKTTPPYF